MQYEKHKSARKIFLEIDKNPSNYLIIHYSCESFYDIKDGHTPRITSIAVYDYATAQTDSFSIHKMAEKLHIEINDIEIHYDELEKSMLDEFFEYAKEHKTYFWIHWNMRDMNYGFKAIEHRYSVLGGEPYKIADANKIDLARQLINCYGVGYTEHPRMEKLLEQNGIKAKDYLNGQEEADAFANREYVKLHMSTLRKVDVFANILNRAINSTLKVNSKWTEIYGVSVQGILNFCKDTWWIQLVWTVISMFLGALVSALIGKLI
ncbi:MAG: hypothetical protein K2J11_02820 [Oscillospiraceae bacterium]|nr:hypothetical protein [Oscillospiraceae bacterium]